jgi:hypothetical protein
MPGLKDIAESFTTVTVKGTSVTVEGIGARGIAYLFYRFPVLREMIGGKEVTFTADDIQKLGPEAVNAIIACGTGAVNDPAAEAIADKIGAEAQLDLIEAIMRETMPNGPAPFVAKVMRLLGSSDLSEKFTSIADGKQPSQ